MKNTVLAILIFLAFSFISCGSDIAEVYEAEGPEFVKMVTVFGITIYATQNVMDEKLLHAASFLAEYLDNDEDGIPDNQSVIDALLSKNTSIVMAKDEDEMRSMERSSFPAGVAQSLFDYETRPGGAEQGVFDAAIEEIIHPITDVGYALAYPEVFGTQPGSDVAKIMDEARGGQFEAVPEKYPEGAWYTYYDETCLYDCQVTEYIYWALTSILGAQDFPGRLEAIQEEWRYNTREKVKEGDPKIYALLTDPQYKFPTVLPDGRYKAKTLTIEACRPE
jgi:hypothetical protein